MSLRIGMLLVAVIIAILYSPIPAFPKPLYLASLVMMEGITSRIFQIISQILL